MDFTTNWDRASDTSLDDWIAAKLETEKELFFSVKDHFETSIDRMQLKEILSKQILQHSDFIRCYEHYDLSSAYWYSIFEFKDWFLTVSFYSNNVYLNVFDCNIEVAEEKVGKFKDLIPVPEPPAEDHVYFDFYMLGQDGRTVKIHRSLLTPNWDDIVINYPVDTQKQLNQLIELKPQGIGDGGKLILLHGAPGSGKSYAIRALMKSIADWAQPSYLMDPERFFASPPYMFDIILSNPNSNPYTYEDTSEEKWRLIIAEDSDEFLRADAKERSGQGLSRLLNLADGILGQGMKVIFLLTTNEPLTNLHPAVIRPGRCIANIEFKPFTALEAQTWLGSPLSGYSSYSLAELYDMKRVQQQIKDEKIPVATGQYL